MSDERVAIFGFIICFCVLVGFCSGCQRDVETTAIKAGLHQDVGSGRWVK